MTAPSNVRNAQRRAATRLSGWCEVGTCTDKDGNSTGRCVLKDCAHECHTKDLDAGVHAGTTTEHVQPAPTGAPVAAVSVSHGAEEAPDEAKGLTTPAPASTLTPGSPEWSRLITASKVAAILGVSPWQSPRSLWHEMRGDIARPPSNAAQSRGHYLEPAILAWWRDQHPGALSDWEDQPGFRLDDWAAATPDAACNMTDGGEDSAVLVEAKSAAYDDDWGEPGTDVIPAYYLVQVQWQMHVSGIRRCYVPIITSRLRFAEYVVDYDAESGPLLEARCRAFYDSLHSDAPPPLDDSTATLDAIRKVHPDIEAELVAECTPDEARDYLAADQAAKKAAARDRAAKSWALDRMGKARFLVTNGVRVARRQPNKGGISLVPLPQNESLIALTEEAIS